MDDKIGEVLNCERKKKRNERKEKRIDQKD